MIAQNEPRPAFDPGTTPSELTSLSEDFPGFWFWREVTGERVRYVARRRQAGVRPYAIVTADVDELRAALALGTEQPGPALQRVEYGSEYPQAIADDYPGWGIRHENGRWTAWCPAVTVHAASAAGLRAAIERAISPDQPD